MAEVVTVSLDDFGPGVRLPEPGEQIGWMERSPDGTIVQWGGVTQLEAATDLGQSLADVSGA